MKWPWKRRVAAKELKEDAPPRRPRGPTITFHPSDAAVEGWVCVCEQQGIAKCSVHGPRGEDLYEELGRV